MVEEKMEEKRGDWFGYWENEKKEKEAVWQKGNWKGNRKKKVKFVRLKRKLKERDGFKGLFPT